MQFDNKENKHKLKYFLILLSTMLSFSENTSFGKSFSLVLSWKNYENLKIISKSICSQCTLSLPPENIRKPYSFQMFSGDRERVHWKKIG